MAQNLREISAAPILQDEDNYTSGQKRWGYIFAALGAVLFSLKAIFIKLAYQGGGELEPNQLDAITLVALRMGFSVPVYLVILFYVMRKRNIALPPIKTFVKAIAVGFIGYYACSVMDFEGLKYITAQLERILLFTYPVFVVILGALFFGGRVTKTSMACIALAYSGILVIFAGGDIAVGSNVALGTSLLMACAVLFALFQLIAKPIIAKMGSTLFTCTAMIASGVFVFTHFTVTHVTGDGFAQAFDLPRRIYVLGAMIALCSTIIPSFLVNIALARISAQAVATIGMISPITTVIIAVILLGEPFGWIDALGTALTILGIGLYTYFDKKPVKARSTA